MKQLQTVWESLDARRRTIAALSAVAILAAIFGIGRLATAPDMALLYSGLDPSAAGEVVAALDAQGVAFEVRDASIYVDTAVRDRTRMALASEGLPASGPEGYELLDGLSGFGTTSQMFDAAYWRAKEGELARTIIASPNVRAARVHLARPINGPFARAERGTASVTVTMERGSLAMTQAQAIRYLVSTAVAGLAPEAVAVLDSAGGVVLASGEADANKPAVDPNEREETLRSNIERLLEARVGPGRAIVEVAVDADMDAQTISERVIDPQSRVAISSEVEESSESQTGDDAGVTVASNLPDGDAGADASATARNAEQSRERMNYEVSETRRERVIAPGQVRRISVAVMVDGIETTAADGQRSWEPRSEAELGTLRELVQSAIGFDPGRGDTVTIQSLEFSARPEAGTLVEQGGVGFLAANGMRIAQLAVLAGVVLALIFFVLRPLLSRSKAAEQQFPGSQAGTPPGAARQIGGPMPVGEVIDMVPGAPSKIDRLREVVASRSDESATVLRNWIEASDRPKEIAGS